MLIEDKASEMLFKYVEVVSKIKRIHLNIRK